MYTDEDRLLFDSMTTDVGHMPCNYFSVDTEGVIDIQGMNDNDLLGNTYARFGPREEPDVEGVCLFMTNFYADDGRYWVTTQPALDLFTQLTGIPGWEDPPRGSRRAPRSPQSRPSRCSPMCLQTPGTPNMSRRCMRRACSPAPGMAYSPPTPI